MLAIVVLVLLNFGDLTPYECPVLQLMIGR